MEIINVLVARLVCILFLICEGIQAEYYFLNEVVAYKNINTERN